MGGFQQVMGGLFGGAQPTGGNVAPFMPVSNYGITGIGGNPWGHPATNGLWQPQAYDYRPWGLADNSAATFGRYWGQNSPATPGAYLMGNSVQGDWQFAPNAYYNNSRPFIGQPAFVPGGYGGYPNMMQPVPMSEDAQKISSVVSGLALLLGGLGAFK